MTRALAILGLTLALAACQPDQKVAGPAPQEPGADAVGTICRMDLAEHHGPKGQVFVKGVDQPFWFSSVRDTFTWLLVDEGLSRTVAAVYVNDMGRAANWDKPEPGTWVEARKAWFVEGSDRSADMGGSELVPFGDRPAAARFAAAHGGRILNFQQIDRGVLEATAQVASPARSPSDGGVHDE